MTLAQRITAGIVDLGLQEHTDKADRFAHYLEMIARWNRVTNLTAVKSAEEMIALHLLDSLSVHPFISGPRVLDVGSGAGLPGIPLALIQPDKDFILLDSNGKKTRFMTQAAIELELTNVSVLQQRIEDCQEVVDQVISRAFTSLTEFVQLCRPRLAAGGNLLAMKGPAEKDQAEQFPQASVHSLCVPGLDKQRYLFVIQGDSKSDEVCP